MSRVIDISGGKRGRPLAPVARNLPSFQDEALKCPLCQDTWLHQVGVSVWRRKEDQAGDRIDLAIVEPGSAPERSAVAESGFPTGRRQLLLLEFQCECCGPGITLRIMQHKGQTFVEWAKP